MMGLGILFVGMDAMTAAMEPLQEWQGFRDMMEWAKNPFVGVLVGAGVTALLQSSSASVGILQALAATGAISLQASLFILFGQNIGTCVTALLASVGANRTAKRAAVVHLLFNIIGAALFIIIALALPLASWIEMLAGANLRLQIAFAHIIFNVVTTLLLLPLSGLLEKLAYLVVRGEDKQEEPCGWNTSTRACFPRRRWPCSSCFARCSAWRISSPPTTALPCSITLRPRICPWTSLTTTSR